MTTFTKNTSNARRGMLWIVNVKVLAAQKIEHSIEALGDNLSIIKLKSKLTKYCIWILGTYLTPMGDDAEFKSDLQLIKTHLNKISPDDPAIILGDFNADPTRYEHSSTAHAQTKWRYKRDQTFYDFVNEEDLYNISLMNRQAANYSLKKRRNIMPSRLDHIILNGQACTLSSHLQANITYSNEEMTNLVGAKNDIDHMEMWDLNYNQGDHRPLQLDIEFKLPSITENTMNNALQAYNSEPLSLKWYDQDTTNKYNGLLWLKYETSHIPTWIKEDGHGPEVTTNLLETMSNTVVALKQTPHAKFHKTNSWWDSEMSLIKMKRDEWYKLKNAKNTERETVAANLNIPTPSEETCLAKHHYYKQLFKIKQKEKIYLQEHLRIKKLRYFDETEKSRMNFWKHVKSIRKEEKQIINVPIETLADQYSDLFNNEITTNPNIDNALIEEICEERNKIILQDEPRVNFNPDTINDLLNTELKNNKAPGPSKLPNEAFKYITCAFIIETIKYIFEQIINLGQLSEMFNTGLITLLIKDSKKSNDDIGNLRPIMLSDTLANLYEKLLLRYLEPNITLSQFQYGFRPKSSCAHAVTVARETIIHYNSRGKPVYSIAVDFTKAFDKLNRPLMFKNLMNKLPGRLWSSIYTYYKASKAYVINNNERSRIFTTSKGVKQGGPMSPFLFASFIDDMLKTIAQDETICKIGSITTGVIAYADDILILCESSDGLKRVVETLVKLCDELDLVINQEKTKIMIFGTKKQASVPIVINIHNKIIEIVTEFKYLGVIITSQLSSQTHLNKRIEKFQSGFYGMGGLGILNGCLGSMLKSFLLRTYCLPILMYGIECIYLNQAQTNMVKRAYTLTLKRCLSLNKLLHTEGLLIATGLEPFADMINKRKLKCLLILLENPTTKNIVNEIITINNNSGIWDKKSMITNIRQIIYANNYNPDSIQTLKIDAITAIKAINNNKAHLIDTENNQRLIWLLNNPSTENWKEINDLLIPSEIAHLQPNYWNEMLGINDLPTNTRANSESSQNVSLNSSGFTSDAG
jgi:hypothetical protein